MADAPISRPDSLRVAAMLKIAANPARLAVLLRLADGDATPRELEAMAGHLGGDMHHHSRLLALAGLVDLRREGRERAYSLTSGGRELVDLARLLVG